MWKNHPYYGKSISTNFPGSPHSKGFVALSRTMRNWWGNPCISHMMKYTIGWESNGKKAPILWEKYEYQFPWLSPYHEFCCIFPYCGKFMRKPMHFPYAEVYHRMGIRWEKKHPYYRKSMSISFPDFPHTMGFVAFSLTVGNLWGNPYLSHMMKYTIGWELDGKKAPMLWEKYGYRFPGLSSYHGFCYIFPYCGRFMGKPMHFTYDDIN